MKLHIINVEKTLELLRQFLPYFFLLLVTIEWLFLTVRKKGINKKEILHNFLSGLFSSGAQFIIKLFLLKNIYPFVYEHRLFDLNIGWYQFFIVLLIYGFLQWFIHLLFHKIRFFWCMHEVHHSGITMNISTGIRTSVFDLISLDLLYLLIPLFGFHYVFYFLFYTLNKFWGTVLHMNESLVGEIKFLKFFLVSPSSHHIHHSKRISHLDKNFGEFVPWFDYLFKTYKSGKDEMTDYGSRSVFENNNSFWKIQTHEFQVLWNDIKHADGLKRKLQYALNAPGWLPHNNQFTVKQLQKSMTAK